MTLEKLLDEFRERYKGARVVPKPVELTECFRNTKETISAPKSYGNLEDNVVLGYIVLGAPWEQKYLRLSSGAVARHKGKPIILPFNDAMKVIACLCLQDMRSTSFHEVYGVLEDEESQIQGFYGWQIRNVAEQLKRYCPQFQEGKDTTFIFAGKRDHTYAAVRLNSLWVSSILQSGHKVLEQMSESEAKYMERVFPHEILQGNKDAIMQGSYRFRKENQVPESVEFLTRKVEVYSDLKRKIDH